MEERSQDGSIGRRLLAQLQTPADLKKLPCSELENLAAEIREVIIETVSRNGGHLASSLGAVELTIALHRVFDAPRDKIVWDVGHQAYAHKLLTGRLERFPSLRRLHGLSGFPKRCESPYDCFDVGHASTSISAALGMAVARQALESDEKIVAVIGDGALTGGLAFEGLNQAGHLKKDLIVILNDNEMSISPNVGALAAFLSRKMASGRIVRLRRELKNLLGAVPRFGKDLLFLADRAEESLKALLTPGMLFEAFGFEYIGPLNGHRLLELIETLQDISQLSGPVLVHVVTRKGKGYPPAERQPSSFHGVGPFEPRTGAIIKEKDALPSYTSVFGRTLVQLAEKDPRVVAITAAMPDGTGLKEFAARFPDRFFDVGIAEQHAVTFAAGLASRGLRPVVAVYSTFLQRAYDSVVHDVCLQNLPVLFALDRGGLVGADGPTHHGVFDLAFLRHIPNLTLMAPSNEVELRCALLTGLNHPGPFACRYPRTSIEGLPLTGEPVPLEIGKGQKLRDGVTAVIIAAGVMVGTALAAAERLQKQELDLAVVDPRFVKPLDRELLVGEAARTGAVITIEENVLQGGFGSGVLELMQEAGWSGRFLRIGLPDCFPEQGGRGELRSLYGIDLENVCRAIDQFCNGTAVRVAGLSALAQ